ncbi:MAG: alpha/beta hydrolase [Pseudomonadota bacterium]|nr:alpha/beta hydrolase [Pseudomonadota bacterium]
MVNSPAGLLDPVIRTLEVQGAEGPLVARLYSIDASKTKKDSLLVFFHAGGFVGGDLDEADPFLRRLSQTSSANQLVLASCYTLATKKPFPAAVEDAHAVLAWVRKNKAKLGWSGKQLVVSGIEAGANLASVAALMARDRGGPAIDGQILIMPMLDPGLTTCSMRDVKLDDDMAKVADTCAASYRGYLPNPADRAHPYASPLRSSRLRNLPQALILSAEDDPLRDEAEQYAAKLSAAGVSTTLRRLDPVQLQEPDARNECACCYQVLDEIVRFMSTFDTVVASVPPGADGPAA